MRRSGRLILVIVCTACGRIGFDAGTASEASDAALVPLCQTATVETLAGNGNAGFAEGTGGAGGTAQFDTPTGVAVDGAGNVYVADYNNHRARKIDPSGATTTLAADGVAGFVDGTASTTRFAYPHDLAPDGSGNLYVCDRGNQRIRKVAPNGTTTTLAGNGMLGFMDGTGGPNGTTMFLYPDHLAVDAAGNVYVADFNNHRIRKIDPDGATITLAGNGTRGFADGTGGAGGTTMFDTPAGIAVDAAGSIYVSDRGNNRIRKIAPDGTTTTLAGSGNFGFVDGPHATAEFASPVGMTIDGAGNLYVAEFGNHTIRKVATDGTTTTVAGNGTGDLDGTGCDARFARPQSLAVLPSNVLIVADRDNHRIRKISLP